MFTMWPQKPTPGMRTQLTIAPAEQPAGRLPERQDPDAGDRFRRRHRAAAVSRPRGRQRPAQRAATWRSPAPVTSDSSRSPQVVNAAILNSSPLACNCSGEPLDDTGPRRRRRTDPRRRPRRRAVPGLAQRAAGVRAARRRPRRPAAAARAHRRTHRGVPGDRPGGPSGAPVCVAMTSGTAVANLGPAVVEANYARVPLIVLRANRPYELLGTGANQTFEQLGYFGTQVRENISLGLAEDAPEKMDASTRSGGRRRAGFWWPPRVPGRANAGPVQFDIPLREPLVPDAEEPKHRAALRAGGPSGRQVVDLHAAGDVRPAAGHRPHARHRGHRRARRRRAPEPGRICRPSPSRPRRPRQNPLHPLALRLLRPKQVIMLGRPTLHRPVSTLLADPSVPVFALTTGPRWPDVSGNSQATGTRAVTSGAPDAGLAAPLRGGQPPRRRRGARPARRPSVDHRSARGGGGRRSGAARRSAGAGRVQPGARHALVGLNAARA